MFKGIFKAYDVRGKYPEELDEAAVTRIGKALGGYFGGKKAKGKKNRTTLIVGHDARFSSPALYKALTRVLREAPRVHITKVGLITTPMLYFLVNNMHAEGGIMVTASHNPKEYNGLKVVGRGAMPFGGKEIEALVKGVL